jgi:hypothetical protein
MCGMSLNFADEWSSDRTAPVPPFQQSIFDAIYKDAFVTFVAFCESLFGG